MKGKLLNTVVWCQMLSLDIVHPGGVLVSQAGRLNSSQASTSWTQDVFLFVCIFDFSHQLCKCSGYMTFASLVKFIPKHFIRLDVIANEIFFS